MLGSQPEMSPGAIAHPGGIQLEDFEKVACPTLFLCAQTERAFSDEQKDAGREVLDKRGIWNKSCVPWYGAWFCGMAHVVHGLIIVEGR